jgi:Glycosyl transferases group 1
MKWIIKCPAPAGFSQRNWGDLHFARSLSRQLLRQGHEVDIQNRPDWEQGEDDADVILLLRGKFAYVPRNEDAINAMWVVSHPADVSDEEIGRFDLCCVASISHAQRLIRRFGTERVMPLLQCTDTRESRDTLLLPASERRDVVFVGNSRNVERWYILEHLRAGNPLKIWGTGWEPWPEAQQRVAGKHVENERLGQLYGSAKATLNDHWPDMAEYGFINNRIFDALACGLPVISDFMPELDEMFGRGIVYYRRGESLSRAFAEFERDYLRLFDRVQALTERVVREHSFAARADELLSAVQLRRQRRPRTGPAVITGSSGRL